MIDETTMGNLAGCTVLGRDGSKIGKVEDIYLDDVTNRPEWIAVKTGWFGSNISLVPIGAANLRGTDEIVVPYDAELVKGAPHGDRDKHLSVDEERDLYAYYDMPYDGAATDGRMTDAARTTHRGRTTTAETGRTDDAMTRSEERMHVGTEKVEAGRARLRKHVVTENVQQTVPVRHEEVRLEREPITDANRDEALSGPDITESEHEVTLHEERPVVDKETVPVERVRLTKDAVTDEETVSGELRKEQIESEGVYPDDSTTRSNARSRR